MRLAGWFGAMVGCTLMSGCPGGTVATCVPGSTQACVCPSGSSGAQSCNADGTYAACACADSDAGRMDAGLLDASESTDGGGVPVSDTPAADVPSSGGCSAPLVACDGSCVDPTRDPRHCGASGSCSGASAGEDCGGTSCSGGRCVYESCTRALAARPGAPSGLYALDVDGSGPLTAMDAYCDMTTAGGGWTLVYAIRNDIPDISDPWWGMVAIGSGTALRTATTPLPAGTHFEGPTRDIRAALFGHATAPGRNPEFRTTVLTPSGATQLDVRMTQWVGTMYLVSGRSGAPTTSFPTGSTPDALVISSIGAPGMGAEGFELYLTCTSATCQDAAVLRVDSTFYPLFGDDSLTVHDARFANTTTLVWVRDYAFPGPRP